METSIATSEHFDTDVVVVGAGPCGLITANLLGLYGIRTLVVERDTEAIAFPRAVGIDDESLRTCQTIGLIDDVLADTVQNTPIRYYRRGAVALRM
jgi:3-(3-hydroxy-phenyl)propionate hydroxylase